MTYSGWALHVPTRAYPKPDRETFISTVVDKLEGYSAGSGEKRTSPRSGRSSMASRLSRPMTPT